MVFHLNLDLDTIPSLEQVHPDTAKKMSDARIQVHI